MGSSFSTDDDVISGINVTPLVDVILVLLIIFMITAPVLYQSAIKIQLPEAKTGQPAAKSPLEFTLSKEGNLFWGVEPVRWEALESRLIAFGNRATQETAIINADQATPHGVVVRLMDALRKHGLTRFALNVDPSGAHP